MLKFVSGDLFEYDATVRINTVNCVGVMGKGVALAFKQRYPAMFKEYKEACDQGEVQPGRLHIWTSDEGTTVVNFPTKRHWRQNSLIEDVEVGLKSLHEFLLQQGEVRVTLPALGCGHGGLDWDKVSGLIRQYLSDVTAEVLVFAPSASRNADRVLKTVVDEATKKELVEAGIATLTSDNGNLPASLRKLGVARLYVRGNAQLLDDSRVACLCSASPTDREIGAATLCVEELAKAGVPIVTGFGAKLERHLVRKVLEHDGNVVVSLPSGILDFKVPKDMHAIWDDRKVAVVSSCAPRQRWNAGAAKEANRICVGFSKSALITDVESRRWKPLVTEALKSHPIQVSFIDYQQNGPDLKSMQSIGAVAVRRRKDGGKPNVDHIIELITGRTIAQDAADIAEPILQMPQSSEVTSVEVENDAVEEESLKSMPELNRPTDDGRKYPRRLIEVDLPIARISAHARREKSIRHGHISTLHIWWARRPLAACRAVICASLWPDPADDRCPKDFRQAAVELISAFANRIFPKRITEEGRVLSSETHCSRESSRRWEAIANGTLTLDPNELIDMPLLRLCLLDFIADFANWDNATLPAFLETSRGLTAAAHSSLGGIPGSRPLVCDPFAGGGSIPLESLRVGADAFASDLNPVAVLLNNIVLDAIPRHGHRLCEAVLECGTKIQEKAFEQLKEFYPDAEDGSQPLAYVWARTIISDAPDGGEYPVEVPMLKSMWLAKNSSNDRALRWLRDSDGRVKTQMVEISYADGVTRIVRRPEIEVFRPSSAREVAEGTVARGSVTCPVTGFTTKIATVREQLKKRRGGGADARLVAVRQTHPTQGERTYRGPTAADLHAVEGSKKALAMLKAGHGDELSLIPDEATPMGGGRGAGRAFSQRNYGMDEFGDLFTPRQQLSLATLTHLIHSVVKASSFENESLRTAVQISLAVALGRLTDFCSSLCVLKSMGNRGVVHTFGRQAIPIVWDFAETNPINETSASWLNMLDYLRKAMEPLLAIDHGGHAEQGNAARHILPDDMAAAFVTDPPYYDAVPYSDLSDYFYVWIKRALPSTFQFSSKLTPKEDECIVDDAKGKDDEYFIRTMTMAMSEGRRVLAPDGIGVVVFAHKSTDGWEAMLQAMISAGWVITGSWPIDTEQPTRLRARGSAALASSVHLVCRPRESDSGELVASVGEWRDVLSELPKRIHEWMPRLAEEHVVGADAIFACLGPALEIYSRFSRVEKSNGEPATLREYLEFVWAAVSTEALSLIFEDADASGLEPDARLTAMWLWTLGGGTNGNGKSEQSDEDDFKVKPSEGFTLEFDAARKIAQGLGVHLEQCETLVEVKADKAKLLPVAARTRHLFGKETTSASRQRHQKVKQQTLFDELDEVEAAEDGWTSLKGPPPGSTTLDRVHQAMILFAANRGELLKRFLVEDGVGKDERFWKLADNLNKLYPTGTEERRWVEGLLARKKGLGL